MFESLFSESIICSKQGCGNSTMGSMFCTECNEEIRRKCILQGCKNDKEEGHAWCRECIKKEEESTDECWAAYCNNDKKTNDVYCEECDRAVREHRIKQLRIEKYVEEWEDRQIYV